MEMEGLSSQKIEILFFPTEKFSILLTRNAYGNTKLWVSMMSFSTVLQF
jgi:hypothetical protein